MNASKRPWIISMGCAALAAAAAWSTLAQDAAPAAAPPPAPAPAAPIRLAGCDVYRIAERLMAQDAYAGRLAEGESQAKSKLAPLALELQNLRDKIEAAGGPAANRDDMTLFQQKQQAFAQAQQQAEREFDRLAAQTNHAAFTEVVHAAERVAKGLGYSHVFSTRPIDAPGGPETSLQFTLGVLARPLIVSPDQDDITAAVIAELKLP